jgi:uncharacterized coiled-coil protein SlyX
MVDSRKGEAMADRIDDLTERVHSVEGKLDQLSTSVAQLSASVDLRFDEVTAAIVEQRQYTEFAWSQLDSRIAGVESRLDSRIAGVESKLDSRIDGVESKVDTGFDRVNSHLARLERKLDHVIDRHLPAPPPDAPA